MTYFNYDINHYKEVGSIHTATEIHQQASTWRKTYKLVKSMEEQITEFISKIPANAKYILTGAGTSEFAGNSIYRYLDNKIQNQVVSISTTDIVTNPEEYLSKDEPIVLVSFGRSGSSPESTKTVELANQICNNIFHIVITCNKNGHLANDSKDKANYLLIVLPDETHDQSFAMTSSYTCMMLAAILSIDVKNLSSYESTVELMAKSAEKANDSMDIIDAIVDNFEFDRIVYLGSSNLRGFAQESALKICELSAGKVDTYFDSPLGFRHGPKSVINPTTLTVVYLSDNAYARKYEIDLANEMGRQRKDNKILVISNTTIRESIDADYLFSFENEKVEQVFTGFYFVEFAQVISLKKAINLGVSADDPCPTGEVSRVVSGVNLYDYKGE